MTEEQGRKPGALRVLTNSERSLFSCERKWWFGAVEGLTDRQPSSALVSGSLMHLLLEHYYLLHGKANIDRLQTNVLQQWIEEQIRLSQSMDYPAEFLTSRQELARQCVALMTHYMSHYSGDDYEVLAVEPQVSRDIVNPDTGEQLVDNRGNAWVYGGKVDAVVRGPHDDKGTCWLMEHKTTSMSDLEEYCRKLTFDPQIRGYAWAPRDPNQHSAFPRNLKILGVIYNVISKSVPEPPKILKNGKPSNDKRENTTYEMFLAELNSGRHKKIDIADYQEKLDALKQKKFFHREVYPISDSQCDDFGRDIYEVARRMAWAQDQPYHPRQQTVCTGPAAYPCPYAGPCLDDGDLARMHLRVKDARHEELDGELAETGCFLKHNKQERAGNDK